MSSGFNNFKSRYLLLDSFLICIASIFITALLYGIFGNDFIEQYNSLLEFLFYIFLFGVLCYSTFFRLRSNQVKLKDIIGDLNIKNIPWMLLLIIFYGEQNLTTGINYLEYFFANLISNDLVQSTIANNREIFESNSQNLLFKIFYYCLTVFVLVVVAPVTEEFIFRGIFLHRWAVKWGVVWSIVLSSLAFGLVHADIFMLSRAVSSIFTALFYIQTKTLLVPILLHAFHNGLVCINMTFQDSSANDLNITAKYLWYGILNVLLSLPVLFYFLKFPKSSDRLPYFVNLQKSCNLE